MKKRVHESVDYINHPDPKQQWTAQQHQQRHHIAQNIPVPMFPGASAPTGDNLASTGVANASISSNAALLNPMFSESLLGPIAPSEIQPQMMTEQQVDALLHETRGKQVSPADIETSITGYAQVRDNRQNKYTVFCVHVCLAGVQWVIFRRYTAFKELYDYLSTNPVPLPDLPPKKIFGTFASDFLDRRQEELDAWLATTLKSRTNLLHTGAVRAFLASQLNKPPSGIDRVFRTPTGSVVTGSSSNSSQASNAPGSRSGSGMSSTEIDGSAAITVDAGNGEHWQRVSVGTMDNADQARVVADVAAAVQTEDVNAMGGARDTAWSANSSSISSVDEDEDEEEGSIASPRTQQRELHELYNTYDAQQPLPPMVPININGISSLGAHESVDALARGVSKATTGSSSSQQPKGQRVCLEDFERIRVLGQGSFGKVVLSRRKCSGKLYAIKILTKNYVVKKKQVEHTRTERSVLSYMNHPFIVKLHFAFQNRDKLHFVLDFVPGGELFFHLGRAGRFSEELGRFYTAEISLALGHLHSKGVVYRDLKPENILIDNGGHIKLADFGLSKEGIDNGMNGTHSFCGTPEYLAPEVLNRTGHGTSVDWWSLGALLFEMLTGLPPWYSQNRNKMFQGIKSSALRFPSFVSPGAQEVLSGFLQRDVQQRLGSNRDVEEIQEHPFFSCMDWNALYNRQVQPPFVPVVENPLDLRNFEADFTRMPVDSVVGPNDDGSDTGAGSASIRGSQLQSNPFDGFTFTDPSMIQQLAAGVGSLGIRPRGALSHSLRRKSLAGSFATMGSFGGGGGLAGSLSPAGMYYPSSVSQQPQQQQQHQRPIHQLQQGGQSHLHQHQQVFHQQHQQLQQQHQQLHGNAGSLGGGASLGGGIPFEFE